MRKTDRWIDVPTFKELYGGSKAAISVTYKYKPKFWIQKRRHKLYVNESYLLRVKKFRESTQSEAEELYYEFIDNYPNEFQFAEALHNMNPKYTKDTWYNFLKQRLFAYRSEKFLITKTEVSHQLVSFVRVLRRRRNGKN